MLYVSFGRGWSSGSPGAALEEDECGGKVEAGFRGENFGGAEEEVAVWERIVRWPKVKGFRGEAGAEGGVM